MEEPKIKGVLNNYGIFIVLIFLLGAMLRLLWIINVPNHPISDFLSYYREASFLYNGHSLLESDIGLQGMGYPFALSYFFRIVGNSSILTGELFNYVFSLLTLIMVYFIFKRILLSKTQRIFAYLIIAILPNYIVYNNVLGTEILATFIFSIIIILQVYQFDNRLRIPLMGIFIALAALTRPLFLLYPIVFPIIDYLEHKDIGQTVKYTAIIVLVMMITISPWVLRNYEKFGMFMPISYNSGYVLYINDNAVNTTGGWMPISAIPASPGIKEAIADAGFKYGDVNPYLENIYQDAAIQWIIHNPLRFCYLGILRIRNVFFNRYVEFEFGVWSMQDFIRMHNNSATFQKSLTLFFLFSLIFVIMLSTFGFLYLLISLKNIIIGLFTKKTVLDYKVLIPNINLLFFIMMYFMTEGQPRYNFPALFLLVISTVVCVGAVYKTIYCTRKQT